MEPISHDVLLRLFEIVPDAMIGVDPEGRIALASAQAERLFGYAPGELPGQSVDVLVPAGLREAHAAHRARYVADPQPRAMGAALPLVGRRADGSEFPVDISLNVMEAECGRLFVAAVRDLTERVEAEQERGRLREQLEQTRRLGSLGQLAGGIAHDFNNLLGVILNYSAFVRETLDALAVRGDDRRRRDEASQDLVQIQAAAERAAGLTRRLLTFGRSEALRPEIVDLNAIVADVEHLLMGVVGEHVTFVTRFDPELSPIEADRGQLEQILVNLTVNARDAMPDGGQLTIDTANVDVDAEDAAREPGLTPGRHVRLRVSDTGTGMSASVVERAFEPFFTTKPPGSGTGLGLATVRAIVSEAGGSVQIHSEPGQGTTCTVLLPAVADAVCGAEPPQAPPYVPGGETVLLVEDDATVRDAVRRILERNGHEVLAASGGAEALEIASAYDGHIGLLLADIVMPAMSGREVARRVRELRPDTRVLYMSGHPHPAGAPGRVPVEPVRVLMKPFTEATLLEAVADALATARAAAGRISPR